MRGFLLTIIAFSALVSCKKHKSTEASEAMTKEVTYASFGKTIKDSDAIDSNSMYPHYVIMKVGDSVPSKVKAKVKDVCQAKGCWMTLELPNDTEMMVKFKDYGFFVPKDIAGKEVIVNGLAYVTEVSVDEQRHYAEDAGKSSEDISLIKESKRTYSFEADGVLIAQ
ncbi:DUF4920 domain-containing protein [Hyunsoonleella sp. SJ7]|uniref:DUF4920 domain-containing protein n=1 Tax=Hyunsoonleella aquatilis TaxID=2762758 RepID=A0A923H9B8_9FLAO|nr:DUF4920 domain-containing protein [Hyunsoonleella aquatilis]MBC3758823.1 DUF4920 domain-containing protein [Hyunsoonleella aquatilis]